MLRSAYIAYLVSSYNIENRLRCGRTGARIPVKGDFLISRHSQTTSRGLPNLHCKGYRHFFLA